MLKSFKMIINMKESNGAQLEGFRLSLKALRRSCEISQQTRSNHRNASGIPQTYRLKKQR